jgi:hypothetical protein
VDAVLRKDEDDKALLQKVNSGMATVDDLLPALKDPGSRAMAAHVLGEMGPLAARALPNILEALAQEEESGAYKKMLSAVEKIEPDAAREFAMIDVEILHHSLDLALAGKTGRQQEQILPCVFRRERLSTERVFGLGT